MIFNRFFRSKHLDPNPHVRIKAIEKLNSELSAEKSVLHELAFNDPDAGVSLAALQKLDSFTLWYKMSEISKDERVLKKSQQIVEQSLFDPTNTRLNEQEKLSFVRQCKDVKLLEKLVFLPWVQSDTRLAETLLTKISKPVVLEKIILESSNAELQNRLMDKLSDEATSRKLLAKVIKKGRAEAVNQKARDILQKWDLQQQLPISIEKDTTMLLSRLLALKEQTDLRIITVQQELLTAQYAELCEQFSCLAESKKREFEQKFSEISQRVNNTIELLKPQWQEEQAAQLLSKNINDLQSKSREVLDAANALLREHMLEITNDQVESTTEELNHLYDSVKQTLRSLPADKSVEKRRLELIIEQIIQCQESLANLPGFMLCLGHSQELLQQFSALKLPDDVSQIDAAEQYLREVKHQWREITQRFNKNLPAELLSAWQQVVHDWQGAIKNLSEQVNQEVARCRNKYRAIEGLINQGRFRLAIDVYSKVLVWYEKLPEKQQDKLNKIHSQIKQQIENLKDWQEYIAAPRKPALLSDAEQLVLAPLSDIEEQAKAIKVLRQQWNSLGVIDSESDAALNVAFDETLEKAFAPCRAHYEQQQLLRAQNLQDKNAILLELGQLNESTGELSQLSKQLTTLQQKWRKTGEVEFSLRNDLYARFQSAVLPLKEKVSAYYQSNAEQKGVLVKKAQQCLEITPIEDGINQIKLLQQQWKSTQHAGKKAEAVLWPAFKEACDKVFALRNAQFEQQKSQQIQQIVSLKEKLAAMQSAVEQAQNKAEFEQASALKADITDLLASVASKERHALERQLQGLEQQISQGIAKQESSLVQRQYVSVFKVMSKWQTPDELPAEHEELSNTWQAAFNQSAQGPMLTRHELTVMLEILKEQASPNVDSALRQHLQLQLMAKKLQDGDLEQADDLLKKWISLGPLTTNEQSYFERVQSLFIY
ncbi:DUF349 domain-containing protein [Paraglaciecola sp.]|uniref:DUF349 domain-containing protein n=1 Tax=Paraglaciecola sp. TaxID=1920173 RepID=UPI0027402DAE|nr:DUF349 domain-containing protein [Paraglaciecola sp.]MDP5031797.1 DUF349 domain-containing protein [Paraglaciecola sp.]